MTDFYTRLEEQLVDARRRRAGRGPLRRGLAGRRPQLIAAAAVVAVLIAAISLLPPVLSSSDGGPATPTPAPEPTPSSVPTSVKGIRVAVLNATTTAGRARDVATALQERGARIVAVADATEQHLKRTTVYFGRSTDARARRVAAALGVVRMGFVSREDAAFRADVVVHVGADGETLMSPARRIRTYTETQAAALVMQRVPGMGDVSCTQGVGAFSWTCRGIKDGRRRACLAFLSDRRRGGKFEVQCAKNAPGP